MRPGYSYEGIVFFIQMNFDLCLILSRLNYD